VLFRQKIWTFLEIRGKAFSVKYARKYKKRMAENIRKKYMNKTLLQNFYQNFEETPYFNLLKEEENKKQKFHRRFISIKNAHPLACIFSY